MEARILREAIELRYSSKQAATVCDARKPI